MCDFPSCIGMCIGAVLLVMLSIELFRGDFWLAVTVHYVAYHPCLGLCVNTMTDHTRAMYLAVFTLSAVPQHTPPHSLIIVPKAVFPVKQATHQLLGEVCLV